MQAEIDWKGLTSNEHSKSAAPAHGICGSFRRRSSPDASASPSVSDSVSSAERSMALSELEPDASVVSAPIFFTGGGASTEGWPLACNWYDTSANPSLWKFNGTGCALYLALMEQAAD